MLRVRQSQNQSLDLSLHSLSSGSRDHSAFYLTDHQPIKVQQWTYMPYCTNIWMVQLRSRTVKLGWKSYLGSTSTRLALYVFIGNFSARPNHFTLSRMTIHLIRSICVINFVAAQNVIPVVILDSQDSPRCLFCPGKVFRHNQICKRKERCRLR